MFRFKRILTLLVAVTLVGTTLPAFSAFTLPTDNRALITVTRTAGTNQPAGYANRPGNFNPLNGPLAITTQVTGATALDVTVDVYRVGQSQNGDLCPLTGVFYGSLLDYSRENPTEYATGSHTFYWNGKFQGTNNVVNPGLYCYRITWGNNAVGVTALREGYINVDPTIPVNNGGNGGNGAGNNGGNGGANGGNGAGNGGAGANPPPTSVTSNQDPARPDLSYSIYPSDIYPASTNPRYNTAIISYSVNTRLSRGLTITIRDGNNYILKTLRQTTGRVDPVTTSVSWNGRSTLTGNVYPAGRYSVVFTSGSEIARGIINVHTGTGPGSNGGDNGGANTPSDISVSVHPTTIDPYSSSTSVNTAVLSYTVRRTLTRGLSIYIYNTNGQPLVTLRDTTSAVYPGSGSKSWNGRSSSGSIVANGYYRYKFLTGSTELASGYIRVYHQDGGSNDNRTPPTITDYGPNPSTFKVGGSTYFEYAVNKSAKVVLTVYKGNTRVATPVNQTITSTSKQSVRWSTNTAGQYRYTIEASNSYGRATTRSGYVTVTTGGCTTNCGSAVSVTAVSASPNNFIPSRQESTTIRYTLNQAANVSIIAKRAVGSETYNVQSWTVMSAGTHSVVWRGKNGSANVSNGLYTIEVRAQSRTNNTSDTGSTNVTVNGGGVNPFPPRPTPVPVPTGKTCGSFRDVSPYDPMCPAINFVVSQGIFAGYPDGTLGLNRTIRRAEFLAVIQKAFKFNLDPYAAYGDGALGYADLVGAENQWFMPYVKTFSRLNIMVGYPDHTMKPDKTMGTAELFVSFFQAAERAPYALLRYRVNRNVDHQPYADTPVNADTYWYTGYAMFARVNDLVPGSYFYPARGITRAQVIDLIYQTHMKGLINYGANTRNPTYPQQQYQDYYYPNTAPTTYPYVAPVISNPQYVNPTQYTYQQPVDIYPTYTPYGGSYQYNENTNYNSDTYYNNEYQNYNPYPYTYE